MKEDWFWACGNSPAGDKFVIANGQQELWRRVKREISEDERCSWMPIQHKKPEASIQDIMHMVLFTLNCYKIDFNKFMIEAVQIPVFANYVRNSRSNLCDYVCPYSYKAMEKLGCAVNETLGADDIWWE